MMMYRFISDPGHGWLEVNWVDLKRLGLNPGDFSAYSYRDRNVFYLEEDCDAPRFLSAFEARHGKAPELVEVFQDPTFIRDLAPIHA